MAKAKYMVVSGFLGAGKTTTMIAFSRVMNEKYGRSAIIANDLGARNLVDADYTATKDVDISEIPGNCICYETEVLVDTLNRLVANGSEIIMSDIPGCGIGALDHVYIKLKEEYPGEYDLLPFTCVVDPERLRMILPEKANINLPEEMRFLLNAQMAEADLIVLNKTDVMDPEEIDRYTEFIQAAYPYIPVMRMSALTGEGVEEVVDYIMTHEAAAEHRDIGYGSEEFLAAEEHFSWYNRRFLATNRDEKNVDFNAFLTDFIEGVRDGLIEAKANAPHIKLFASGENDDFIKLSLLGVDYDIEYASKLEQPYAAMSVIINIRATSESQQLNEIVEDALDEAAQTYNMKASVYFTECFGLMDEGRGNFGRASRY